MVVSEDSMYYLYLSLWKTGFRLEIRGGTLVGRKNELALELSRVYKVSP